MTRRAVSLGVRNLLKEVTLTNMPKLEWKLNYKDDIFFVGSCFSEVISSHLQQRVFNVAYNPLGIMFNPISIQKCVGMIKSVNKRDIVDSVFQDKNQPDIFHSWDCHTTFSNSDRDILINSIYISLERSLNALSKSKAIFVTLGSSFVHRHVDSQLVVSNCHKQSADLFQKEILSISDIIASLESILESCRFINNDIKVVFTVSPVRHTREGLVENQRSKSHLIAAVHEVTDRNSTFVSYFPSYEVLVDELRDYRWYGDDLIHPSTSAESIVFSYFSQTFFDSITMEYVEDIENLLKRINHRPMFENSEGFSKHLKATLDTVCLVEKKYGISLIEQRKLLSQKLLGRI